MRIFDPLKSVKLVLGQTTGTQIATSNDLALRARHGAITATASAD